MPEMSLSANIIERMKQAVGAATVKALADELGISSSSIGNWKSRGSIPITECMQIAETHNVSLDWLLRGHEGSHFVSNQGQKDSIGGDQPNASIPLYDVEGAAGAGRALDHESVIGSFQLDNDTIEQLGINDVHLAGVRVRGDSMEPTLTDNDWVIVDLDQQSYAQGGVFLIWVSGELRIKRLQRLAGGAALLISDNKLYDREMITFDKMQEFSVLGRVVLRLGEIS
ncbi:HTH-type transcriptional regulator PrtR [Carnimonas sp. LMG 33810]